MTKMVCVQALLYLLCTLVSLFTLAAGNIPFQKRLIDNNLPNVGTYSIVQGPQGYLWLASTNTGLLQFDGYQFQHHPLFNRSLSKLNWVPDIDALAFDHQGDLWVGSWGYGLARIRANDGNIDVFNGAPGDTLASTFVQTLFHDNQQRLWIGTTTGINYFTAAEGLVRVDSAADAMPSRRVWGFAQTGDGTIWIATSAGLHRWHQNSGISPVIQPNPNTTTDVRALHVIDDVLWLGTSDGLYRYQPKQQLMQQVMLPDGLSLPIINTLTTSIDNNLLIGTFSGIYAVNTRQNSFVRRYQHQLAELENINIRTIFIDQSQVTWVGTRESGLYFKPRQRRAFQNSSDLNLLQLQKNLTAPVQSLLAEPDALWLGQYGHLSRYQHNNSEIQHFFLPGRVNVIRRAPDGSLWVGTDNGIFRQQQAGEFQRYSEPFNQFGLLEQNARDIHFADDDTTLLNLWHNGVILIDQRSGSMQRFLPTINRDIIGDAIQAVHVGAEHIWLASRLSGIYLLNRKTRQLQTLHQRNSSPLVTPAAMGQLTCLSKGPANSIVVCTEYGALLIAPDGQVTAIDREQGLDADALVGAYTDTQDTLWLLSTAGLYARRSDGSLVQFDHNDGLNSDEMMFRAVAEDQRQLYFGSSAGLELVNARLLRPVIPVTQQAISKITFDQGEIAAHSGLKPLTTLTIPASVYRVGFHFASFDFNNPKRNSYRYMLDGYDSHWQHLTQGNIASYTNLAPGKYRLQMMASNNQRHFSGTVTSLDIEVLPHWWQRKTIQFLGVFLLIILTAWLVQRRLQQARRVNALLQQAVAERTAELQQSLKQQQAAYNELQQLDLLKDQFISTVSHELRTPLTAISGALELVVSGTLEADVAKQQQLLAIASSNSKRLTLLINDLLDLEKLAAHKMQFELKRQPIAPIVQRAVAENSTYGHQRQLHFNLIIAPDAETASAEVDEYRLLQVLANLLSNAIKFSPAGAEITIRLTLQEDEIVIAIQDQGPGIALEFQPRLFQRFAQASTGNTRAHGGTGLGLALSQELMHAMHGQISFVSVPGNGCTFYLRLPRTA